MRKVSTKKALATTNVPFQEAAFNGGTLRTQAMNAQNRNKNDKPLLGLLCLVDTINEDGIDATKANQNLLRDLGAQIVETLGESVTHFICSGTSFRRNSKRAQAADLLDVPVVSPLWIEKCRELGTKVNEVEFLVSLTSEVTNKSSSQSAKNTQDNVRLLEPVASKAASLHSVDSSFFCSSERKPPKNNKLLATESQTVFRQSKRNLPSKIVHGQVEEEEVLESEETTRKLYNKRKKISAPTRSSIHEKISSKFDEEEEYNQGLIVACASDQAQLVHVPLPSFRESTQQVDLDRISNKLKRRRSERISDMLSDSEDSGAEDLQSNNNNDNNKYFQKFSSRRSQASNNCGTSGVPSPGRARKKNSIGSMSSPASKVLTDLNTVDGSQVDGEGGGNLAIKPDTVLRIVYFDKNEKEIQDNSSQGRENRRKGRKATRDHVEEDGTTVETDKRSGLGQKGKRRTAGAEQSSSNTICSADESAMISSGPKAESNKAAQAVQIQSAMTQGKSQAKKKKAAVEAPKSIETRTVGPIIDREDRKGPVFMLTGFDVIEGERRTIAETLRSLIHSIYAVGKKASKSKKSSATSSSSSTSSSDHSGGSYAHLLQEPTPADLMEDDALSVANLMSFTHLIAEKRTNTRTLRVLFAIARGLWILTEEWVYESICQNTWASCEAYRHPRYCQHSTGGEELRIFAGKSFLIGKSTDPAPALLKKLIEVAGGTVLANTTAELACDFLVMGNHGDALEWSRGGCRSSRREKSLREDFVRGLVRRKAVVISKFIFNCIESTRLLEPSALELVSEEQFGWLSCSDEGGSSNSTVGKRRTVSKPSGSEAASSTSATAADLTTSDTTVATKKNSTKNIDETNRSGIRSWSEASSRAMRSSTVKAVGDKTDVAPPPSSSPLVSDSVPSSKRNRSSAKSAQAGAVAVNTTTTTISNSAAPTKARKSASFSEISPGQHTVVETSNRNETVDMGEKVNFTPVTGKISDTKLRSRSLSKKNLHVDQLADITAVDDDAVPSSPILSPLLSEPLHRSTRSRTPRGNDSTLTESATLPPDNPQSPYTLRSSSAQNSRMTAGSVVEFDPNMTLTLSAKAPTLRRTPAARISSGTASAPFSGKVSAIKGTSVSMVDSPEILLNETTTGTALNETAHSEEEEERSPVHTQVDTQRRSFSRLSVARSPHMTMPAMTQCEDDSFVAVAVANRTNDTQQAASSLLLLQSSSSKKSVSRGDRTLSDNDDDDDLPVGAPTHSNRHLQPPHPSSNRSHINAAKDSHTNNKQTTATKPSASSATAKKPRREFVDPYANYSKSAAASSSSASSSNSMSPAATAAATSFPATRQTLPLQQVSASTLSDRKYGRAAASKLLRGSLFVDSDEEIDENRSNNDTPTNHALQRPSLSSSFKQTGPASSTSVSSSILGRKASTSSSAGAKRRLLKNGKARHRSPDADGEFSEQEEF